MNITEIKLLTPGGFEIEHAVFSVRGTKQTDKYILRAQTGLGADEIVPMLYGRAQGTNLNYYHMALRERQVSLVIKLNPQYQANQTVGQLRDLLYRAISFNRQGKIELRFMSDETNVASLFGFITKVEVDPLSSNSEVTVMFKFPDPFLRSSSYIVLNQNGQYILRSGNPLIELDDNAIVNNVNLQSRSPSWEDVLSNSPHGYKMEIEITAEISSLTIRGIDTPNYAPFIINYTFSAGDILFFSSEDGNRYIYVVRTSAGGSTTTHLTDKVALNSIWPIMVPGLTTIGFSTPNFVLTEVSYRTAYWGI